MQVDPVELELKDGRRVTVRAIHEKDGERLQQAIRGLSLESSYKRFFSPLRELPSQLLQRAIHPEPGRELQLVAVVGDGADETIVAGSRFAALPEEADCEFAIAIVDGWHGCGLARSLMEMLMQHARVSGFPRMVGYVLATNAPMLGLAQRLGFTESACDQGPSVRMVSRDLRSPF